MSWRRQYIIETCKMPRAWQEEGTFDIEGRLEGRPEVLQRSRGRKNSLSHWQGVNGVFEDHTLLFSWGRWKNQTFLIIYDSSRMTLGYVISFTKHNNLMNPS